MYYFRFHSLFILICREKKNLKHRSDCNIDSICAEMNLKKKSGSLMVHIILVKPSY